MASTPKTREELDAAQPRKVRRKYPTSSRRLYAVAQKKRIARLMDMQHWRILLRWDNSMKEERVRLELSRDTLEGILRIYPRIDEVEIRALFLREFQKALFLPVDEVVEEMLKELSDLSVREEFERQHKSAQEQALAHFMRATRKLLVFRPARSKVRNLTP